MRLHQRLETEATGGQKDKEDLAQGMRHLEGQVLGSLNFPAFDERFPSDQFLIHGVAE